MIKSPLRYPGGKSKAIKFLYPVMCECDEFYEPFAGGASLGIYVSQMRDIPVYLNDINHDLICFWEAALNQNEILEEEVVKYYNLPKVKETYNKILLEEANEPIKIGARFFALNRITYSGTIESGGYSGQAHKKRFTESSIKRLKEIKNLNNITVGNNDYRKFLNRDFSEKAFVFLDPPYYSATKSALYGKNGDLHKIFSHKELYEFLVEESRKFKFMMTYDNSDFIKEMYKKNFYIYEWKLQYGMTNKKIEENNEILISNYKIENKFFKEIK